MVVVTGGGSGLGRTICEAAAEYGADVVCVGRSAHKLQSTLDAIAGLSCVSEDGRETAK